MKMVRPFCLRPSSMVLSHLSPLPNGSQKGSCTPYVEITGYLLSCHLERKLYFCHWFIHAKLISSPFSETDVSKSAISLCFISVSAGEILITLCTKLFDIILKLFFFGVGGHWPSVWLWELSTVWAGSVLIFESLFPYPKVLPSFWWGFCEVC